MSLRAAEARLPTDRSERPWRQVGVRLASHGYATALVGMAEDAMAASLALLVPAIFLQLLDHVSNLHAPASVGSAAAANLVLVLPP